MVPERPLQAPKPLLMVCELVQNPLKVDPDFSDLRGQADHGARRTPDEGHQDASHEKLNDKKTKPHLFRHVRPRSVLLICSYSIR